MSTILYIGLCLIKNCSWQSFGYGLFECLVFYLPFWFIRICFSATYHSDNWFHCRFWTRIMLCGGVTFMWLFPIKYSLVGGICVAFLCCLILYLVAIETNEKKFYAKKSKELQATIDEMLSKEKDPKEKLLELCRDNHISERDTKLAVMYYIDRMKPKQIWEWMCDNNENVEYDSVYKILNRLNKKLK